MLHRVLLFTSSYIPLYILLLIKFILEKIEKNESYKIYDYVIVFILIVIAIASFVYLKIKVKKTENNTEKLYVVNSCKNETVNYFFNYIAVYFISSMGLTLTRYADLFVIIFLMILIGYIYVTNNVVYINPVLNFMGYKIYEMELYYSPTDEKFNSIVLLKKADEVIEGMEIKGTTKSGFILSKRVY